MTDAVLNATTIAQHLKPLAGWSHEGGTITRVYQTDGWRGSVLVANAIAFICEAADHHADILVTWPRVTVRLSTHSAGGITAKDIEVATLIERQVSWRPPVGSSLAGPATPFVKS